MPQRRPGTPRPPAPPWISVIRFRGLAELRGRLMAGAPVPSSSSGERLDGLLWAAHTGALGHSGGFLQGAAHARGVCPAGLLTVTVVYEAPGGGTISRAALEPGTVLFFPPGVVYEGATSPGYRWSSAFLMKADVDRLAATSAEPITGLLGSRVLRASAADDAVQELAAAECSAGTSRARRMTQAMQADHAHALTAAWMRLLAQTWPAASPIRSSAADRRAERVVHAADRFLRRHLADVVYLADVAKAVGSPPRTLEHMFCRRLGLSPMAYLTWLRMSEARRRLLGWSGPAARSVIELAAAVGFPHPGRFAAAYRATFGESPRETLAMREATGSPAD